jgi:hypothetical protein
MAHMAAAQPTPSLCPWLDILARRVPPEVCSVFLRGEVRIHEIALRTAASAVVKGLPVALVEPDTVF